MYTFKDLKFDITDEGSMRKTARLEFENGYSIEVTEGKYDTYFLHIIYDAAIHSKITGLSEIEVSCIMQDLQKKV